MRTLFQTVNTFCLICTRGFEDNLSDLHLHWRSLLQLGIPHPKRMQILFKYLLKLVSVYLFVIFLFCVFTGRKAPRNRRGKNNRRK